MKTSKTLGIYAHLPFCASRCSYCHFVIDLERGEIRERYVDALLREIELWSALASRPCVTQIHAEQHPTPRSAFMPGDTNAPANFPWPLEIPMTVDSIYFGGGTPSELKVESLKKILDFLRRHFQVTDDAEITIEVNPESTTQEKIRAYRAAGINRVSVGVQSFHDHELRQLGRLHSADEAKQAIEDLRQAGFENISLDLLAGLPGQTRETWKKNLEATSTIQPEHVSLYLFDVDGQSFLGRKALEMEKQQTATLSPSRFTLPDDDEVAALFENLVESLDALGYAHYEISNFAKRSSSKDFRSQHNLKYWNLQPYLGLGCAAHSFVDGWRWRNTNSTREYIEELTRGKISVRDVERLSRERLIEDAIIFGLRQIEGVEQAALESRFHFDLDEFLQERNARDLLDQGWLVESGGHLRLASKSVLVSNEIFERLLKSQETHVQA